MITRTLGPSTLALPELRRLTRRVADEVLAGRHEVRVDPHRRWYQLLSSDGFVDVWLISWAQEQAAELHDHAGSLGALTVVRGALAEHRWVPTRGAGGGRGAARTGMPTPRRPDALGALRSRVLAEGRTVGFPVGHVHDVVNTAPEPAVSVHAYSPPLTAMSYYRVEPGGLLRRTRSELTSAADVVTA